MNNKQPILEMKNVTKQFGTKVTANANVSLTLYKGEILSLLGENGSGKTTLMNIVAGIYFPDEGEILINGEQVQIHSPSESAKYKIGMVHQHFKLVDVFSGIDNIILGENKDRHSFSLREEYSKINQLNLKFIKRALKKVGAFFKFIGFKIGYLEKNRGKEVFEIAKKYGFDVDLNKKIYEMSVSEKQTVEILKVLYRGAEILILDEPTAVLTPQEIRKLFNILKNMREDNKSIIIITHKLNEVMEISDRVAVLRKGKYIGDVLTSETNEKQLTEMMVGQKMNLDIARPEPKNSKDRLFIRNINYTNSEGRRVLKDISFTVRSGEILGIAGISGNGQKELLESVSGLVPFNTGEILFLNPKENAPVTFFHHNVREIRKLSIEGAFYHLDTKEKLNFAKTKSSEIRKLVDAGKVIYYEDQLINLKYKNPQEIRELGIRLSFVPEDRLGMGLVPEMDLVDNMMLRSYRKGFGTVTDRKKPGKLADKIIKDLEVVTPGKYTPIKNLSGGNIQKLLVGREIAYNPKVLMAAYPVRGLDINSSYAIYDLLNQQKEKGVAVLFVGEDLDVMLSLCDRLVVLCDGQVNGIVDARTITKEEVGKLMTKLNESEAQ